MIFVVASLNIADKLILCSLQHPFPHFLIFLSFYTTKNELFISSLPGNGLKFWLPCLHTFYLWFILNLFWFSFSGYSSGSLNGTSMHGALAGARGPFTPSQWMELEHQALIYKYLTANMPVPSNLLIPIRKALDSAGFSSFPGGLLRPNTCKSFFSSF